LIIIEDVFYDPENLYSRINPEFKNFATFHDFGFYDHKLIVFRVKK
jgi:hypothetical protein